MKIITKTHSYFALLLVFLMIVAANSLKVKPHYYTHPVHQLSKSSHLFTRPAHPQHALFDLYSEQGQTFMYSFAQNLFEDENIQNAAFNGGTLSKASAAKVRAFLAGSEYFTDTSVETVAPSMKNGDCLRNSNAQNKQRFMSILLDEMEITKLFEKDSTESEDMTQKQIKAIIQKIYQDQQLGESIKRCQNGEPEEQKKKQQDKQKEKQQEKQKQKERQRQKENQEEKITGTTTVDKNNTSATEEKAQKEEVPNKKQQKENIYETKPEKIDKRPDTIWTRPKLNDSIPEIIEERPKQIEPQIENIIYYPNQAYK